MTTGRINQVTAFTEPPTRERERRVASRRPEALSGQVIVSAGTAP
jgi:hypothetical protein